MNPLAMLILAMAVAAPVVVWAWFFLALPSLAHSRYRNHLWRIRDDLVDDILSGTIANTAASRNLAASIELMIVTSRRQTLVEFATIAWALKGNLRQGTQSPLDPDEYLGDEVPLTDRTRLLDYAYKVRKAVYAHLLAGSPLGWIAWLMLRLPGSAPRAKEFAHDTYRTEVKQLPIFHSRSNHHRLANA